MSVFLNMYTMDVYDGSTLVTLKYLQSASGTNRVDSKKKQHFWNFWRFNLYNETFI